MSTYSFSGGGYLVSQCILLVMAYGNVLSLPWWVTWFPSLLIEAFILGALAVLIIGLIIAAVVIR